MACETNGEKIPAKDNNETWSYLKGSKEEVMRIKKLMGKLNFSVKVWTDSNASEMRFNTLDGNSPDVIHIATHGYTCRANKSSQKSLIKNSMFDGKTKIFLDKYH